MHICRRFMLLICAGVLASATLFGCGGSSTSETIPSTVSIYYSHSVIFRNHTTFTMGYNAYGQLGDGTLDSRSVATRVPGMEHMLKGAAGAEHTLVFGNNSSVMAWGYNGYGQIGPNVSTEYSTAYSNEPVKVPLHALVSDIAAGGFHSLAIAGGKIYGWGYNLYGQLGNDLYATTQKEPVLAGTGHEGEDLTLLTPRQVAAGGLHSLALFDNGDVYAWGSNSNGQLGFSTYSTSISRPKKVALSLTSGGKVEQIAALGKASLALEVVRDGLGNITGQTLWGWGYNPKGELGADPKSLTQSPVPVPVHTIVNAISTTPVIKKIATGVNHVLLLMGERDNDGSDGSWTVQALGYNYYGQLGNNKALSPTNKSTTDSSFELVHTYITGTTDMSGVTDIAAFGHHSLALVNGVWYGWGDNTLGQLGNPRPESGVGYLQVPVPVGF